MPEARRQPAWLVCHRRGLNVDATDGNGASGHGATSAHRRQVFLPPLGERPPGGPAEALDVQTTVGQ